MTDRPRPIENTLVINLATLDTVTGLFDVAEERVAQVARWGVQVLPDGTRRRIYEGAAAACRAETDRHATQGKLTWTDVLKEEVFEALTEETDPAALRRELVQVAAVAVAWIEDLDRRAAEQSRARSQTS